MVPTHFGLAHFFLLKSLIPLFHVGIGIHILFQVWTPKTPPRKTISGSPPGPIHLGGQFALSNPNFLATQATNGLTLKLPTV